MGHVSKSELNIASSTFGSQHLDVHDSIGSPDFLWDEMPTLVHKGHIRIVVRIGWVRCQDVAVARVSGFKLEVDGATGASWLDASRDRAAAFRRSGCGQSLPMWPHSQQL